MSTINDGGPAFPGPLPTQDNQSVVGGMSLRDYFAAKALAGLLQNPYRDLGPEGETAGPNYASRAAYCYAHADAMLAARSTTP